MTEIERILKKGLITPEYLKEETDCEFLVTEKRKKLWAVLLDMIYEFDQVCKKHGLKYYLVYGALLGAVRHKGFIPWDDDFDVAMPRADYEKFITLSDEFKAPLFLQTPYTDKNYFYSFAKLRNSNTSGIVQMFKYTEMNHGMWISMFPLDFWDDNGGEKRYLKIRELVKHNSTYMRVNNPNLSPKDIERVEEWKKQHRDPLKDYEELQKLASSCKDPNSKYVATAVNTPAGYHKKPLDAAYFADTVPMEFEGLTVPAPCGYDPLLKKWYGDYMQFPPVEERGKWHGGTVFDSDIPYKEYLAREGIVF